MDSLGGSPRTTAHGPRNPASVVRRPSSVRRTRLLTAAITYLVLVLFALVFVAPFVWMVSTSLKPDTQIFSERVRWVPHPILWRNYPEALASFPFLLYLRNTLFICFMTVAGTVFSPTLPAYGFSRIRWEGRDALFLVLLMTIMLPAQGTMLPVFLIFRWLRWAGTFLPLIIPPFLRRPFSIFLL